MRLSVRHSLMIGMGVLVGLIIVQALVGIGVLETGRQSTRQIVSDAIPSIRLLGEVNLQATRHRLRTARHILNDDPAVKTRIEQQLAEAEAALDRLFADFEALPATPSEIETWRLFRSEWAQYLDLQQQAIRESRRGAKEAATETIERQRDDFLEAVERLRGMIQGQDSYVVHELNGIEQRFDFALIGFVALSAAAFLFALGAWKLFVTRTVVALDQMTTAMREIASGRLNVPVPAPERHDEIGAMAEALCIFRDSLVETAKLRAQQIEMDAANLRLMSEVQEALSVHAARLDAEVAEKTGELADREREIVWRLSRATDRRDTDTGDHIVRMSRVCGIIAEGLGLPDEEARMIEIAAQMHDVGKVGIPDDILFKPGKLTAEERAVMETHVLLGWQILKGSKSPLIQLAADIAYSHHERWDGNGYPNRLAGDAIPLAGRIAALADVFDALVSERPYKKAWPLDEARAFIEANAGEHFDPDCVVAFLARWDEIAAVIDPPPSTTTNASIAA
ncbi:HD domain-containing phosphohydrolase [Prosthecodimorpha staleyi]|uniref:MCP four helix bundle domain-containing protein n=1 Tax=Prosthecodimorpha staleyi TaxID=2840188 RepID=A0A947D178_9HYPH|nr:HD domain-containing phosphohydrolase [Prosthecodimorpha staleyi]MBT9288383.1 MCP four helix bundle domain-containing protein [Prosthecodimorpha staleyi]